MAITPQPSFRFHRRCQVSQPRLGQSQDVWNMRGVCKRSIHENLDLLAEPKKTLQQAMEELKAEDARLFRMRQIQIRTCLCCVGLLMTAVLIQIASLNPGNPPKVSASTAPVEEKMRPSSKVVIDLEEDHSNTSLTGRNITLSNSSPP